MLSTLWGIITSCTQAKQAIVFFSTITFKTFYSRFKPPNSQVFFPRCAQTRLPEDETLHSTLNTFSKNHCKPETLLLLTWLTVSQVNKLLRVSLAHSLASLSAWADACVWSGQERATQHHLQRRGPPRAVLFQVKHSIVLHNTKAWNFNSPGALCSVQVELGGRGPRWLKSWEGLKKTLLHKEVLVWLRRTAWEVCCFQSIS